MKKINCEIESNELVSDWIEKIEQSPDKELWNATCYFLNQIIGLKHLDEKEENYMQYYWRSILIQSQLLIQLDKVKKHNRRWDSIVSNVINTRIERRQTNDN